MTVYLIGYDLVNEKGSKFDYQKLWDELKRLGAHRVQLSLWLANVSGTAQEIAEHIKGFVDKDDRVWVSRVRPSEHWYVNAIGGTNDWLKRNPPT